MLLSMNKKLNLKLGEDLLLDILQSTIVKDEFIIGLSFMELKVLYRIASEPGRIIPTDDLLCVGWNSSDKNDTTKLYVLINQLRKKIEDDPSNPRCLVTIRKRGYVFYKRKKIDN